MVMFHPAHTLEKHFAFLGLEFEVIHYHPCCGYGDQLDDQLFNAIRYDPGVKAVGDNTRGWRD
jgi:hypothetical protein